MSELLTVKELQALLKLDRLTVYRMLKDGRLTGVKIGHQWRFSQDKIDALLLGTPSIQEEAAPSIAPQALPIHCVQMIQNVFSEVAQVASVTVGADGETLTDFSNPCAFCNLILSSEAGRRGCVASWQKLTKQKDRAPRFATCHAGLNYARARIELDEQLVAVLIAGQFYIEPPDAEEEAQRIKRLSQEYGIDHEALAQSARYLQVLDVRTKGQLGRWLESMAHTFEQIGSERAALMNRLRTIAAMCTFDELETV